jgi:hypothetical protein
VPISEQKLVDELRSRAPVGSLEVRDHEDVEEFGSGSGTGASRR